MFCQKPPTINVHSTSWTAPKPGVCRCLYAWLFSKNKLISSFINVQWDKVSANLLDICSHTWNGVKVSAISCLPATSFLATRVDSMNMPLTCYRHTAHTSAPYLMYLGLSGENPLFIPDNSLYTFLPIFRVNLQLCERDPVALSLHSETKQTKQRNKVMQLAKDSPLYYMRRLLCNGVMLYIIYGCRMKSWKKKIHVYTVYRHPYICESSFFSFSLLLKKKRHTQSCNHINTSCHKHITDRAHARAQS